MGENACEEQGKQTRSKLIHVQNPRKAKKLESLGISERRKRLCKEHIFRRMWNNTCIKIKPEKKSLFGTHYSNTWFKHAPAMDAKTNKWGQAEANECNLVRNSMFTLSQSISPQNMY